jgi:hypothetical protein
MAKIKNTIKSIPKSDIALKDNRVLSIKKEHILLILIFILAIGIRIHADPNMPFHYDPGKNIVYARAAIQTFPLVPQTNPFFNLGEYYEYQVLFPYLVALLYKLTSISLAAITSAVAVLSGAALCVTVYMLSQEIFEDKIAALLSAFLIAVSNMELLTYINYYPQILAMTFMPLACVFLIRHIRSEKFQDLFLAAILSGIIVLASYLTAFVYFLVILMSLAVWSLWQRKIIWTLFLLPCMTAFLTAFFWLPIVWRHGIQEFTDVATGIVTTTTPTGFTNQAWSLPAMIEFSSGAIIALILGIVAIIFFRKFQWDFAKLLITIWLVVSFLLMASYLIKPILWVDRFVQFFDIALLIFAGIILALVIKKLNANPKIDNKFAGYLLLVILLIPLFGAINFSSHVTFGKWGYPSDHAMADYMQNLPAGSLVVSPPGIQSFWFSSLSDIHVLGGESPQMIDIGYQGDGDSDTIINSPDINLKMELIRKYGVNYIVVPLHNAQYGVWNVPIDQNGFNAFNNSKYFDIQNFLSDDYGGTVLIRVRENLSPKYNTESFNWNITIAGYLSSILSFIGFTALSMFKKIPLKLA